MVAVIRIRSRTRVVTIRNLDLSNMATRNMYLGLTKGGQIRNHKCKAALSTHNENLRKVLTMMRPARNNPGLATRKTASLRESLVEIDTRAIESPMYAID